MDVKVKGAWTQIRSKLSTVQTSIICITVCYFTTQNLNLVNSNESSSGYLYQTLGCRNQTVHTDKKWPLKPACFSGKATALHPAIWHHGRHTISLTKSNMHLAAVCLSSVWNWSSRYAKKVNIRRFRLEWDPGGTLRKENSLVSGWLGTYFHRRAVYNY